MRQAIKRLKRRIRERRSLRLGLRSRDPFVIMRELIGDDAPVIFDVGAHVGVVAARFRRLFPRAVIHCFEPFPESFDRLRNAASQLRPIELHALALAAREGEAAFSVNVNPATNSLLASDASGAVYWRRDTPRTRDRLTVRTTTLDAFCEEQGIGRIDILKMDVQGGEYDVLLGAPELLARQAVGLVYLELITAPTYVGQHRIGEYLDLFDGAGYELFDFFNLGRGGGRLLQLDAIFASPETLRAHVSRLEQAE